MPSGVKLVVYRATPLMTLTLSICPLKEGNLVPEVGCSPGLFHKSL